MANAFICVTCGIQYSPSSQPPAECKICTDDRQFIGRGGQEWTTQEKMNNSGFRNCFQIVEPNVYGMGTVPKFGIGQRALLIRTEEGNLLWDCITLLDESTIEIVKALGGIHAIAISHPHYYSTCIEWSLAFDNAPIYIHERDEKWLGWPHENVNLWAGETLNLWRNLTLIQLGGHFAGAQVLHWAAGSTGKGSLLTGDILQVGQDKASVSVMRSYPNFIPVSEAQIVRIKKKLEGWNYETLHGAFWDYVIQSNAQAHVNHSLDRYIEWLNKDDVYA